MQPMQGWKSSLDMLACRKAKFAFDFEIGADHNEETTNEKLTNAA